MADLPEWVRKYKKKGIYVTVRKGKYYLYRGHSERKPGKKYPQLICDEYLGQVTQAQGLIPATPSVKPGIRVLEFGLSFLIYQLTYSATHVVQFYRQREDLLYVRAVLAVSGQPVTQISYDHSWLSLKFKGVDVNTPLTANERHTLQRIHTQMEQSLHAYLGEDFAEIFLLCRFVSAVWVNRSWHLSVLTPQLHNFCCKYDLFFALGEEIK
ncbi:MAG: hypothetical protein WC239_12935 [Sphaerochaetaceae bacterium]